MGKQNVHVLGRRSVATWVVIALTVHVLSIPIFAASDQPTYRLSNQTGTRWSVGIDGQTAIVGAGGAGEYATGTAYLFDVGSGIGLRSLTAADGYQFDRFGQSVGIGGNIAIVGAPGDDGRYDNCGSAYLFNVTSGQQIAKLANYEWQGWTEHGYSVAIGGNYALVGSNFRYARLFDTVTGLEVRSLVPDDYSSGQRFGRSVGLSGTKAIVGADRDSQRGYDAGAAYLFDASTGRQIAKLVASDGAQEDYFGVSVAVSGNIAVVGSYWDDDRGHNSGSVYVFDAISGQQLMKLTALDGTDNSYFGYSVAVDGNLAVVGAPGADLTSYGAAYLFDLNTGCQIAKITGYALPEDHQFGWGVGISGINVIVGTETGSAYLFAIPEPSSLALLALGGMALLRRRRTALA